MFLRKIDSFGEDLRVAIPDEKKEENLLSD